MGALGAEPATPASGIEAVGMASAIPANVCEAFHPATPAAGIIAIATSAAMIPYSLEVAALSSRRNPWAVVMNRLELKLE